MERLHTYTFVVGGGPAGAMAARTLAEAGREVLLVERDFANEKPCGGGLFLRAFDEFAIPRDLITKEVKNITIVGPDSERVDVDIAEHPIGVVHRQAFDAALREQARDAGAQLIEGRAIGVAHEGNRVRVVVRDKKGELLEIEAEWLIAADGVNSTIRRHHLGSHPSRILTWYADLPDRQSEACQFWFGQDIAPGHYAWIFPHYQGINVGLVAHDPAQARRWYKRFFAKADLGTPPKPKGYHIPHWKPSTLHKDRILYVGDSAALVLPFTYEGIYYALKSGRLAAEALVTGDPAGYPRKWETLYGPKFRFLRRLQSIFLRNDWLTRRMVQLYRRPRFQRAVLGYWSGSRPPESFPMLVWKVVKSLVYYR